ncbi:MAG: hypothetical protein K2K64_07275 [Muribaculaceae bacterium]|nr:hypothetical protein [Muribaculaceae bacterium]
MSYKTRKTNGMFPGNQPIEVEIHGNGDIEYLTPLPEFQVTAFTSDAQLGDRATPAQYYEWYLNQIRKGALDKAKYARIGFAPLTYKASDTAIFDGESLKEMQRQFGDTIEKRQETGFYDTRPYLQEMDSILYKRMDEPMSGFSCINSQTNYYAPRFANKSNIDFAQNHFGFRPISLDSLRRGDIIQLCRPWKGGAEAVRPFHAVIFDSYNGNGDVNVWDQHGAVGRIVPDSITYLYKSPDDDKTYRAMNAFRFIGDQQTENEIREGYEAYRKRNNLQD